MNGKLKIRGAAHLHRQSGQAMVEFMLVVVFLFILFVSILQMILFMYAYTTLADAAKEGIRYAIVHGTGYSSVNGGAGCSGPGDPSSTPTIACPNDNTGQFVKNVVTNFAGLSFQSVVNVTVDYDPNSANTNNPKFNGPCSAPGCLVRVTVAHTYNPLFGLSWPNFAINAAADGRIMN